MVRYDFKVLGEGWGFWKYQVSRFEGDKRTGWTNFETAKEAESYLYQALKHGFFDNATYQTMMAVLEDNEEQKMEQVI